MNKLVIPGWAYLGLLAAVGLLTYVIGNATDYVTPVVMLGFGACLTVLRIVIENTTADDLEVASRQRRSSMSRLFWG